MRNFNRMLLVFGLLSSVFCPVFAQTPAPPQPVPVAPAAAPVDIEFLVDVSGSMEAKVGLESQMEIAKKSIKQTLGTIPPSTPVALRVYAHRVPKSNKEASCQDTELLIPFQPLNVAAFSAAVDSLKPNGYTPIAYSLRAAAQDFAGKESQHVIILLSDGEETCGGDPVAEARNLLAQGFKVTIHTIGFRVDPTTKAQLAAISSATGGSYYDASDAASLTQNLAQATQKALLIAKPAEQARGQEVRGGNQYADAVPLQSGIEYRLDHHQRQDQYDYFYLDLKQGQGLTVWLTTQDKGISVHGNEIKENSSPYAGFRIVGPQPDYQEIGYQTIIGDRHGKKGVSFVAGSDNRYYILVGNKYGPQHKDSPFRIEAKNYFDAGQNRDAGGDVMNAMEITTGDYPENWVINNDDKDFYKIDAKAGEGYSVIVTPGDMKASFSVAAYDGDRRQFADNRAANEGAVVRLENIRVSRDGPLYFEIKERHYGHREPFAYAMNIQAGPAEAVAPSLPNTTSAQQPLLPQATTGGATTLADQAKTKSSEMMYGLLALAGLIILGLIVLIVVLLMKKKTTN